MRVILVNAFCPPYAPGGAEFSMVALASGLIAAGVQVTVVTPNYGESPELPPGLTIREISAPFKRAPGQNVNADTWLGSPEFDQAISRAVIDCWRPGDVVHLQGAQVLRAAPTMANAGCGPIVLTVRDTATVCPTGWCMMCSDETPVRCCRHLLDQLRCAWGFSRNRYPAANVFSLALRQPTYWRDWYKAKELRAIARRLDRLVVVSEGFRRILAINKIFPNQLMTAIGNIPPDWPSPSSASIATWRRRLDISDDDPIVLAVGKRSLGKGTGPLIEAMVQVVSEMPSAKLVLVGKGTSMSAPFCRVLPFVKNEDLPALYAVSSVVTVPSIWPEPLSRVLLEGMTMAKPIVASDVGGTADVVVDGATGWLVPPRNVPALSRAILNALRSTPSEREAIGAAGAAHLRGAFSAKSVVDRMLAMYRASLQSQADACR